MNPLFRELVEEAREIGVKVIDRCNLTILFEPGQQTLAQFLADHEVEVVASLPCYLEENVDRQRGKGVFDTSIRCAAETERAGLRPTRFGADAQSGLQPAGSRVAAGTSTGWSRIINASSGERFGIVFNELYV